MTQTLHPLDTEQATPPDTRPFVDDALPEWSWDLPTTGRHSRQVTKRHDRPQLAGAGVGRKWRLTQPAAVKGISWVLTRRLSFLWLLPLLAVTAIVRIVNLGGSPRRIDDEGTYTAQAYAVNELSELAHYTYWYDHPPLGWVQIALWTKLTGGFDRYEFAVLAAREFMVVASLVSVALLWLLARRLGLSRPAAGAAALIFALSPLAVQYHRSVFLDNVATPWLLAAFVFAFAPRRQLAAYAAGAFCFAIAVLSKETYLLFGPFLAWQMWSQAHRGTRRYTLSLAAALTVVVGLCYVLFATLRGELLPSENRVSLASGIMFQLGGRASSGSLLNDTSAARVTFDQWMLDPGLLVGGSVAALLLLILRKRRFAPIASAVLFLAVFALRPGYLPVPYIIALLPFFSLLIPALVEVLIKAGWARTSPVKRWLQISGTATAAVLAVVVVAPIWMAQAPGLLRIDHDRPMRDAQAYVASHIDREARIIVDDAMWVDMVEAGFDRDKVVWYYKVDTDKDVVAAAPNGWRDYDFVVSTHSIRTAPEGSPQVNEALANSTVVASFGSGEAAVTVHQIQPEGESVAREQADQSLRARKAFGKALARDDAVDLSAADRRLMTAGSVDGRVLHALRLATKRGTVNVEQLPAVATEETAKRPRRQVVISELDGKPVSQSKLAQNLTNDLDRQPEPFKPESVERTPSGRLLITYGIDAPAGV